MGVIEVVFSILILILSVVIHEVSHGYAAYSLGDPTAKHAGRLTLNPIKHLDPIGSFVVPAITYSFAGFIFGWAKPVPYNPYNISHKYGEALVAGAGPLSNIIVALFFGGLVRLSNVVAIFPEAFIQISILIVFINIILAIFNLIPVPPLDGSKILFNFLPYKYRGVREFLERYGFVLILIFVFFLWELVFPIIFGLFNLITGMGLSGLGL